MLRRLVKPVDLRSIAKLSVAWFIAFVCWQIVLAFGNYFPPRFDRGFLRLHREHFDWVYAMGFYSHVVSSPLALVLGLVQFSRRIRTRYGGLHRRLGQLYLGLTLVLVAPGGMVIAFFATGGWISVLGFFLLAVGTWVFTWLGFRSARRMDWVGHARWMMRSYVLMTSAVQLRLLSLLASDLHWDPITSYRVSAWVSWLVPLVLLEIVLRYQSKHGVVLHFPERF